MFLQPAKHPTPSWKLYVLGIGVVVNYIRSDPELCHYLSKSWYHISTLPMVQTVLTGLEPFIPVTWATQAFLQCSNSMKVVEKELHRSYSVLAHGMRKTLYVARIHGLRVWAYSRLAISQFFLFVQAATMNRYERSVARVEYWLEMGLSPISRALSVINTVLPSKNRKHPPVPLPPYPITEENFYVIDQKAHLLHTKHKAKWSQPKINVEHLAKYSSIFQELTAIVISFIWRKINISLLD